MNTKAYKDIRGSRFRGDDLVHPARTPRANAMPKVIAAALVGVFVSAVPAAADPVADFYKGKQIRFVVRTTPATDYDQYSRLIARFMGKHIPGNPSFVVVNMPGGGGITAANYMAQV